MRFSDLEFTDTNYGQKTNYKNYVIFYNKELDYYNLTTYTETGNKLPSLTRVDKQTLIEFLNDK